MNNVQAYVWGNCSSVLLHVVSTCSRFRINTTIRQLLWFAYRCRCKSLLAFYIHSPEQVICHVAAVWTLCFAALTSANKPSSIVALLADDAKFDKSQKKKDQTCDEYACQLNYTLCNSASKNDAIFLDNIIAVLLELKGMPQELLALAGFYSQRLDEAECEGTCCNACPYDASAFAIIKRLVEMRFKPVFMPMTGKRKANREEEHAGPNDVRYDADMRGCLAVLAALKNEVLEYYKQRTYACSSVFQTERLLATCVVIGTVCELDADAITQVRGMSLLSMVRIMRAHLLHKLSIDVNSIAPDAKLALLGVLNAYGPKTLLVLRKLAEATAFCEEEELACEWARGKSLL